MKQYSSNNENNVPYYNQNKKKTVLMIASVASMIEQFNMSNIKILQDMDYQVEVACNFNKGNTISEERIQQFKELLTKNHILYHQIDFERNVLNLCKNIKAYKQIKKILTIKNTYKFLHCHSPIGGVVGRIAGLTMGIRVIYTAHGFHFYKGAPLRNWFVYYPIEKYLSRHTNILITINKEDFTIAQKFHSKVVRYIPGIGINTAKYHAVLSRKDIAIKRSHMNLSNEDIVLLSVGELNKNKNHQIVIRAIAELKALPIKYLICGQGKQYLQLKRLTEKLNLEDKVYFLGYRTDIKELYEISDIFIFPSKREGLSVSLMEAMASGKPIICSKIRGNIDLVEKDKNGILCSSYKDYINAILILCTDKKKCKSYGEYSLQKIENFNTKIVNAEMKYIYEQITLSEGKESIL